MPLAEEIARYGSVAVAGLAKNVGKTVTLNHLIREGHRKGLTLGVTSIGVDGESIDQVSMTRKPEIRIYKGMRFATSEAHFRQRRIEAEITGLSGRYTSLGRVVTGRALADGKILLSGPADTVSLRQTIEALKAKGASTVLVDGALSRVSLASPAVTDALILATGAALSPDISRIVARTAFVCRLTALPQIERPLVEKVDGLDADIWGIDEELAVRPLGIGSALNIEKARARLFAFGTTIYNPGIVTERFLKFIASQKEAAEIHLIVRDFTRMFAEPQTVKAFLSKGGRISVAKGTHLLGVTANPYSPAGYSVDKERLVEALRERLEVPVEYIRPA